MITRGLFTSESVTEGHPDKLADQIADAIVDAFIARDAGVRVACEVFITDDLALLAGEFRTREDAVFHAVRADAEGIARRVLREAGYRDRASGIDPEGCEMLVRFNHQSADIARGVDPLAGPQGAGDQGLMFGFACDETPELMPLPIVLAHRLVQRQAALRRSDVLPWLRPDGKSQVTVRYVDGRPVGVETVVLSTQHDPDVGRETLVQAVQQAIVEPVIPPALRGPGFRILVNPTGSFVIGGPRGDTGLTGRKNIVDTYGGACPHGGGALSGKDPSKVDRSAAYAVRHVARNVVAAGLARRCTLQVAYAIGVAEPVSLVVDTGGTGRIPDEKIEALVAELFDLTPAGMIGSLDLLRPIYRATAAYGHFGRPEAGFSWERDDRIEALRASAGVRSG
jgi:S-adenosylmethionine synthetase